jgi:hypothetical protein
MNDDTRRLCGPLNQQVDLPELEPFFAPQSETQPEPVRAKRPVSARLPRHTRYPRLTEEMILAWADEWFETHGSYPTAHSGRIGEQGPDTWSALDQCLRLGLRSLPGGTSLCKLITSNRVVVRDLRRKKISSEQILQWADAWFQRTGKWPIVESGVVSETSSETWSGINQTLKRGIDGVEPGSSLNKFLNEMRAVPMYHQSPLLTVEQILAWADTHFAQTGEWPKSSSGAVVGAPGETWEHINWALNAGTRSLEKHVSLARLLTDNRGVRHRLDQPSLTLTQINNWVLKHYLQHHRLPRVKDGEIPGSDGESWQMIDESFRRGRRGLARSGYSSLKAFLESRFPKPEFGQHAYRRPRFSVPQILRWADAYYSKTGKWPCSASGEVAESEGDTWLAVNHALTRGTRGMTAGKSLDQLLGEHRNHTPKLRPDLSTEAILRAADVYCKKNGCWPTKKIKGPVPGIRHETWASIDQCLNLGIRGLPLIGSLSRFLHSERGARHRLILPDLTLPQIERWARSYKAKHGHWPSHYYGGAVEEAPAETWRSIYSAFKEGRRGLATTGYISLTEFCRSLDSG